MFLSLVTFVEGLILYTPKARGRSPQVLVWNEIVSKDFSTQQGQVGCPDARYRHGTTKGRRLTEDVFSRNFTAEEEQSDASGAQVPQQDKVTSAKEARNLLIPHV